MMLGDIYYCVSLEANSKVPSCAFVARFACCRDFAGLRASPIRSESRITDGHPDVYLKTKTRIEMNLKTKTKVVQLKIGASISSKNSSSVATS